jgi:2-isopropylmalate synthase
MPWEVESIIRGLKPDLDHPFGIHTHNDSECAVINSLTAIREGAMQVQGTINGVGERCGNANLISIAAGLESKIGYLAGGNSGKFLIFHTCGSGEYHSRWYLPFVSRLFAHKGGVHVGNATLHKSSNTSA